MLRNIFILVVCVLATILTVSAQTPPNNEIWYTTTDKCKISITKLDDVASHTYVNGKGVIKFNNSVTEIGKGAFSCCTSLTSINIPNSVTEISSAFDGCTSLRSINIPNSVTEIWDYAFHGCTSLKSFKGKFASADGRCLIVDGELIAFAPAGLTSYTIPYGVTEIGDFAFSDCKNLTSITIPNSVTEIGWFAFRGCTSLTSVTIPDSVTGIGKVAFSGCTSLTSITIPNSVTWIGDSAFGGCTGLTSINISDSVTWIREGTFYGCTSLRSITIPDSVIAIEKSAFCGCTSLKSFKGKYASADGRCLIRDAELLAFAPADLTSYTIPDSVTEIGENAFSDCTSLTSINIPDSVTGIGWGAFVGCTSLTSITIPNSVTGIGENAFVGCTSLRSITIPDSVTVIWGYTFEGCNIEQITISAVTGNIFRGCDGLDPSKVVAYTGKYASEDGRCLIKDGVLIDYIHNGAERYEIPNGVTIISGEVFKGCSSLKSITIPDSVTEIGYSAFSGCTSLTSITIPNSGIGSEYNAFEGCNIKQITINAVTGNVFKGCGLLDPSKVVAYTGKYASEDGRCLIKDGVLIDYIHNGAERYEIPNGVTIIGYEVFKGCSSLKSITIPEGVTCIGSSAFNGCTSLRSITIPDSVIVIWGNAFEGCTSLTSINIPNSGIGIEYGAFEGCNIEQITINAVTGNIFRGRNGLDPSKVVAYTGKYASEDGRCLIKDGVLIDIIHTGLTSYVIPENITTIGKGVFKGCSTLKEITIPNSVTMIGEGAFEDCNIERITINAVTGNVFEGCGLLDPSKVVAYTGKYASKDGRCLIKDGVLIDYIHNGAERYEIPNGVTIIRDGVFRGCSSLTSITCLATTPPQITTLGISEEAVIYVPKEAVKLYKKDLYWSRYKKQIMRIKVEK